MGFGEKVCLISLGCPKNLVDSENILGILDRSGYVPVSGLEEAETAVINTCGFVQSAVEETIDTILEAVEEKTHGRLKRVFVTGCFVQRYGYKLRGEIPEVDGWLGTGQIERIAELLGAPPTDPPPFFISRPLYLADHRTPRVQTTPFYTAYLKIAEGCCHRCTFCLIPALTGPYRSRDPDSIMAEATVMAERGVKEINLVAQDTASYGLDLPGSTRLEDLLERLAKTEGLRWIRLLYCHPWGISDRLLELLDGLETLCPYLDVPLQHVSGGVLRSMGRAEQWESPQRMVERIRSRTRRISIRTTLMVGFPGETEEDFKSLCRFVEAAAFERLGTFIYSPEQGTPAARLPGLVEPLTARQRRDEIMGIQAAISRKINEGMVGKVLPVLIEGMSPETDLLLTGRTPAMAPEVDGQVLINKGKGMVGDISPVRITAAHTHDLIGEIL
ncbi:MAG: 30S ribosomal protein S12 methylthiotransferase RimO [Deltaproteobacteria bacterium]|nr:30S ribosomal protein S12 methylthiotransferase RimO [Deltaproteobacteria bacterium]